MVQTQNRMLVGKRNQQLAGIMFGDHPTRFGAFPERFVLLTAEAYAASGQNHEEIKNGESHFPATSLAQLKKIATIANQRLATSSFLNSR